MKKMTECKGFNMERMLLKTKNGYIITGYYKDGMIWWKADNNGYTVDIREAGKYTKERAKRICERKEDTAWKCEYIDNLLKAQKLIIDSQYPDRKYSRAWRGRNK